MNQEQWQREFLREFIPWVALGRSGPISKDDILDELEMQLDIHGYKRREIRREIWAIDFVVREALIWEWADEGKFLITRSGLWDLKLTDHGRQHYWGKQKPNYNEFKAKEQQ
jgi:hypothetical protein